VKPFSWMIPVDRSPSSAATEKAGCDRTAAHRHWTQIAENDLRARFAGASLADLAAGAEPHPHSNASPRAPGSGLICTIFSASAAYIEEA